MQRISYTSILAMVGLVALLTVCDSQYSVAIEEPMNTETSYSNVFDDLEIKQLLEQSRSDGNYKPPVDLVQYCIPQDAVFVYDEQGKSMVPTSREQKQAIPFFSFLDIVVNRELADKPYQYRKTVCKIILRYFLSLTPSLDTLYARQLGYRQYAGNKQWDQIRVWDIAGNFMIDPNYDDKEKKVLGRVPSVIRFKQGSFSGFCFWITYDTCGGYWSSCCGSTFKPKISDMGIVKDIFSIKATGGLLDLREMDLSGFDMTDCHFVYPSDFSNAKLENAIITDCNFGPYINLTLDQIKSTWNYKHGRMEGITLPKDIQDALDAEKEQEITD